MYIIYNEDGSVRKSNLTDYIQKGNDNINSIFIGIKGRNNDSWACSVLFTLPDGDVTTTTPIQSTKEVEGVTYNGWTLSIPADATIYEGNVALSITIINLQNHVLFTYKAKLVINPSTAIPDETRIAYSQYESLLQLVLQKPAPLQTFMVFEDIRGVDLSKYDEGQIFYDKRTLSFFILEDGQLEIYSDIDIRLEYASNSEIDALFE